jgi:IclR helix-turn-helix domain
VIEKKTEGGLPLGTEQKETVSRPVSWTVERDSALLRGTETREPLRPRVWREQPLNARLRLATTRLAEAERERLWAIVAAHDAGLSIRQIAAATGLSRSRIHQLLQDDAREIPAWLTHRPDRELPADVQPETDHPAFDAVIQARIADEVEFLRWCIDWLEQLERGELVVVNPRPDPEADTEFVRCGHARVRRVLTRMAAALDVLARQRPAVETGRLEEPTDPPTRHRRRLAEPEEQSRG